MGLDQMVLEMLRVVEFQMAEWTLNLRLRGHDLSVGP
jgi:hypothetical protein